MREIERSSHWDRDRTKDRRMRSEEEGGGKGEEGRRDREAKRD